MISDTDSELHSPTKAARLPSLQALRCFEAAARLEHFSRAAEELHLTHGAVSRAVRLLEEDLGLALFERHKQRVRLTAAGRQLAQATTAGLDLVRHAVGQLRARAPAPKRWVLSCEPTLLMRWLIPRWPDFQAQHPDIDIHLVAGGGVFDFGDGMDLALRRNDFAWPTHYVVEPLFAEAIGPVCRPDKVQDWLGTGSLSPSTPLLHTRSRPSAWADWATATGHAVHEDRSQSFEHFYFSLQASVAGLGVAIGPWHLVCDDVRSGLLAAPWGFVPDGSHYCLLAPQPLAGHSPPARLLQWLRHQAAQDACPPGLSF